MASELRLTGLDRHYLEEAERAARSSYPKLTVNEIERLAKAGVAIDLHKVQIVPEKPEINRWYNEFPVLIRQLTDRINTRWPLMGGRAQFAFFYPYPCGWGQEGGVYNKIAVFVVTRRGAAAVLEDNTENYPSEALMAKLALLLEAEK